MDLGQCKSHDWQLETNQRASTFREVLHLQYVAPVFLHISNHAAISAAKVSKWYSVFGSLHFQHVSHILVRSFQSCPVDKARKGWKNAYIQQKTGFPVKKLSNLNKAQTTICENVILLLMCKHLQCLAWTLPWKMWIERQTFG